MAVVRVLCAPHYILCVSAQPDHDDCDVVDWGCVVQLAKKHPMHKSHSISKMHMYLFISTPVFQSMTTPKVTEWVCERAMVDMEVTQTNGGRFRVE